ncbi:hypothetical protein X742_32485 [Mesorhizobium sp. LNHC232B00]|nr:hypothetical protein X742_32485 [Mesorhizobium sp. LNHC232B00]
MMDLSSSSFREGTAIKVRLSFSMPVFISKLVKYLASQGIIGFLERMIEVVLWIVGHANALHDPARGSVFDRSNGHDLVQL